MAKLEYPLPLSDFPKWERVLNYQELSPHVYPSNLSFSWMTPVKDMMEEYKKFNYIPDAPNRDYWKTPSEFSKDGGGDCEDFAIYAFYKFYSFVSMREGLEIVVGYNLDRQLHAVLHVRPTVDYKYIIVLDMLMKNALESKIHQKFFTPIFALSEKGGRIIK